MSRGSNSSLRVLFYAINGTGLGHLSRLLAIAREARELLHAMGVRADFHFITTSEAPEVAWDFPVYKIPSKTIVAGVDTPNAAFAQSAKLLISNLTASLRPDVLVLDTVPTGSFNEFVFLKDYAKKTVFIDRHKDTTAATSTVHQTHLALYDLILVPDYESNADRYPIPSKLCKRRTFTGRIHGFNPDNATDRDEVRQTFGVGDRCLIYVSAGGGGDAQAENDLQCIVDALADDPKNFLLIGYGPLFRGRRVYRSNVVPLSEPNASRLFRGIDMAISAAGYNTYEELLAAGVPSAFYAQQKGLDRQDLRIEWGEAEGLHLRLNSLDKTLIRAAVERLKEADCQNRLKDLLKERGCSQGGRRAAFELIKLASTLASCPIDRSRLSLAMAMRAAWKSNGEYSFSDTFAVSEIWDNAAISELDRESDIDAAKRSLLGIDAEEWQLAARHRLGWGLQLKRFQTRLDWNDQTLQRFVNSIHKGGSDDDFASRQRTLASVIEALDLWPDSLAGDLLEVTGQLMLQTDFLLALDLLTHEVSDTPDVVVDRVQKILTDREDKKRLSIDEIELLLAEETSCEELKG